MSVVRVLLLVASAAAVIAVLHDAFEVMLLPRRVKSKLRIVRYFFHVTWMCWSSIARSINSDEKRDEFLGLYGPLSLVLLLVVWAAGLVVAFGSLFWSSSADQLGIDSWLDQVYFSGVTFFTLGYGDILPRLGWTKALSVSEAGTGLGFIAMVIGYLPVIYQLFSRREAQVITLDSLAGSPPAAVTMISRYAEGHSLDTLDDFLLRWQHWCADLLESHLSYPMLAYYRSQHDNQSWLAALTAIMDLSVLVMVGFAGVRTLQARLTFATARLAAVEMGRVLGVNPRALDTDRLSSPAFLDIKERILQAGLSFVNEQEAQERLASFRNTYEPFLNGLAVHLILSLPPWSPSPEQLDNWVNSPRGKSAKRLIESVEAKPETEA